jgi:hypothetical protein
MDERYMGCILKEIYVVLLKKSCYWKERTNLIHFSQPCSPPPLLPPLPSMHIFSPWALRWRYYNPLKHNACSMFSPYQIWKAFHFAQSVCFLGGGGGREDLFSDADNIYSMQTCIDRLCGLVVRVLGYRSGGPGSIPDTTRKKK